MHEEYQKKEERRGGEKKGRKWNGNKRELDKGVNEVEWNRLF